ncbi:beta-lactamase family protein [Pseudomonas sp. S75]|uniref:serine hydrolase domain-containing protein n=1 Tax=unclassified Pseudomonas TaxID=196821 RepID=UPI0019043A32|nr:MULTISPECIES: serine hydrolase domain-containing protein [unclassified Pseudomonas]MBJ9977923.1 beta-lactamase family protein [Pseudomonas sp. S30]MBK0155871.1 beta-lactamase family protein [Pseudomonas sp. S75]
MTSPALVHGQCHPRFEPVRTAFAELMQSPFERGAALCLQIDGETVVDLWAGQAGPEADRLWHQDTLLNLFSCTKPFTAVAIMQMVGEGRLDLDAPLCQYWPAFAEAGKASITLRQVLCHRAGLPALRAPLAPHTLYDWDAMAQLIATEQPWAAAGERQTYSPLLFGWILGELLQRVDGVPPAQSICQRVAAPLGLDFHLGLDDATMTRCAFMARTREDIVDPAFARVLQDVLTRPTAMSALAFANPPMVLGRSNEAGWKRMTQPAANGHGNARSLATFYTGLLDGRLLESPMLNEMLREHSAEYDPTLQTPARFGLGVMLDQPNVTNGSYGMGREAFGHMGAGGTVGFADPQRGVAFGFACNTIGSYVLMDPRARQLASAAAHCL